MIIVVLTVVFIAGFAAGAVWLNIFEPSMMKNKKVIFYLGVETKKMLEGDNKMTIYVAGKITGLSKEESDKKFEEAAKMLREQGHRVFIPTVLPAYDEVSHDDYLHICFSMIDICECVYMLKNWQQSKGAKKERLYATAKGKVILYEDESIRESDI